MTIRVLVVDDEEMVRAGFRMILDSQPDISVVGEADDGRAAIDETIRLLPDVVLMDIRMKSMDGLEATRTILSRAARPPRVVMLTTFDYDEYVYEALKSGASAFLLKDAPAEQLSNAVRVVADGDALLHPSITRRLIEDFAHRPTPRSGTPPEFAELSERELEVTRLLARGLSNMEVARDMHLSEATVKTHVAHVLAKLGLRDRTQVVVMAYETGLVEPGDRSSREGGADARPDSSS
jgi:DNA-binding NarL/FixJ family response regulator